MSSVAFAIAILSAAAAVASWVAGAVFYLRTLRAIGAGPERHRLTWLAVAAWPFALKRLTGAANEHAAKVNKSIVAFLTCAMVAAAAVSVAANLHRFGK